MDLTEQLILDRFTALEAELAATKAELASIKEKTDRLWVWSNTVTDSLNKMASIPAFRAPFSWLFGGNR